MPQQKNADRHRDSEKTSIGDGSGRHYLQADKYGDLPLPGPPSPPAGGRALPARPTTIGAAAQLHVGELRELGIGRPAPEIDGMDLDGKPMKLSDYRGKIVAIYFCGIRQLRAGGTNGPAIVTDFVRDVAESHANDPFTLLGLTRGGRDSDRARFQAALKASGLPARFWWEAGQDGKPGPIRVAWSAADIDSYVLDHHGVIRYRHVFRPELFEKAVTTLLKEQKDETNQK